jgi:hypothetical protein
MARCRRGGCRNCGTFHHRKIDDWPVSGAVASSYGAAGALVVLRYGYITPLKYFLLGAEFTKVYANRHGSKPHVTDMGTGAHGAA